MNVSEMNDVVEFIRAKLSRGEILKPEDLEKLQPLIEFESFQDGNCCSAPSVIPYLNKITLNDTMATTAPGPQLVRYVGMVQDMLDPEYYEIKDDKGRPTHFRDYLEETRYPEEPIMTVKANVIPPEDQYSSSNGERRHCDLAERIPLVVVPIPFASEWFRQIIQHKAKNAVNSIASTSSPKSVVDPPRKRARDFAEEKAGDDDDNNAMLDLEVEPSKHVKSEDPKEGGIPPESTSNHNIDNSSNDWWPAGSCGTSNEDCPVLAKFSYEQLLPQPQQQETELPKPQSRRRLLLNDLVSLVGVLSMNPWEADFSQQQQQEQNVCFSIDEWMGDKWGVDDFAMTLPPPSRLPRLHVLRYQVLDLDDIVMEHVLSPSIDSSIHGENADTDKSAAFSFNPYCPDVLLKHFSGLNSYQSVAYSLWLCLLSKADRKRPTNDNHERYEMIHVGPMERALGCLSLHVLMPDLDNSRAFFQHLAKNVLPHLCPVVATIDCSRKEDLTHLGMGPSKDSNGRLRPCPLQLPAGSVVLIHYHPTFQTHQDNAIKAVMDELVQHHRLSYRFEGGVVLPFEADYQIIVVSNQTQKFPCTVSMKSKGLPSGASIPTADMLISRKCLGRARSDLKRDGSRCQVTLSSSLTVRAQRDFLSRRRSIHETKDQLEFQGVSPDSVKPLLPGEDDFHRWLNTTKLLAKSRIRSTHIDENQRWEATERDWEVALELDDTRQ